MKVHKVLYSGGNQTIATVPVGERGAPLYVTSGTYEILDLRESEDSSDRTIASGSFTTDSIDHTLTAAAGPSESNDRLVTVADVTSYVVGTTYLIQGLTASELFEVAEKDATNNRLYARTPLRHDHAATTSSVRSVEIKCTFPTGEASNEDSLDDEGGPYLVVWNFTANGKQYIVSEQIFLVRYDERPFITETEVLLAYPGLAARARNPGVPDAIKVATDDFLAELEAAGRDPTYFKASRAGKMAIRNRAIEYLLRWQQTEEDDANADRWESRYRELMNSLLNGVPPQSTVHVDPVDATSSRGTVKDYGHSIIRRS